MSRPSVTLADGMARGRENNFDIVRAIAAMSVVVSHAWPLALGGGTDEPFEHLLGTSLGGIAVLVFFFVSGMLITHSAHTKSAQKGAFVAARAGRILPGLLVALVITVLLAVFVGGGTPGIAGAMEYIARGLSLASLQHEIPGAYAANSYPLAVNGPLWTLFYEVACYILIAGAVWLGLVRTGLGWGILISLSIMAWLYFAEWGMGTGAIAYRLSVMAPLALAFAMGGLAWALRDILILKWRGGVILVATVILADGTVMFFPMLVMTLGYLSLLIAYRSPVFHLGGDISYGIYIYGWPVAQAVVALFGAMSPLALAAISGVAVIPFAILSWVFVEKPAISMVGSWVKRQKASTPVSP